MTPTEIQGFFIDRHTKNLIEASLQYLLDTLEYGIDRDASTPEMQKRRAQNMLNALRSAPPVIR